MRANTLQIRKEARQLAWPWTILMLAGSVVLARPWFNSLPDLPRSAGLLRDFGSWVLPVCTFLGTALLAVLPLGAEFQYRTLAMRFAQPLDRGSFWRQKFLVTAAAVVPPAILFCVAIGLREGWPFALMAASYILVTLAGAIPWTLLARTTIGGMVLNMAGGTAVIFSWSYYQKHGQFPLLGSWIIALGFAAYSVVMVWLGRRMLLRYQAVDGMQAAEGFVPGGRLLPDAVSEWFRCRPRQPLLNLVRREFHLLRTLWPIGLLYLVAWILLVVFHQLPGERPESQLVPFVLTLILGLILAVLAGSLSLGEEKVWGTHDWHMTAPVSVSVQWAVKLLFALFTSVTVAALLPLGILWLGGWFSTAAAQFLTADVALGGIAEAAAITLAAFWCACVVKGAVQATLWVFPVCFAIGSAAAVGDWIFALLLHPIHSMMSIIVSWLDPITVERAAAPFFVFLKTATLGKISAGPLLAVALIQCHRLFRAQVAANKLRVVLCALPLMATSFLCTFGSDLLFAAFNEGWRQESTVLRETDAALAASLVTDPGTGRVLPRRLTPEDLASTSQLSPVTQGWLHNASILVAAAPEHGEAGPGLYFPGRKIYALPNSRLENGASYSAVVRTARGRACSFIFQRQKQVVVGFVTVVCD